MKETAKVHLFESFRRTAALTCIIAFLSILIAESGCSFKRNVKVELPPAVLNPKTASLDYLLGVVHQYDVLKSLSCNNLELTFTSSRKIQSGFLEQYPTLHGYILLKRPDSIHLVLQAPVTKTRLFDVLSVGDQFSVWSPRDGKFYEGSNSAKKLAAEGPSGEKEFTVPRGTHIIEAIFPQSALFDSPDILVGVEEQKDSNSSYYVLTAIKPAENQRFRTIRKIWIERAGLTIARQQMFAEDKDGEVVSDIIYSKQATIDGFWIPLQIHIDRPLEGYILDLRFSGWKVNPELGSEMFELKQPTDAQVVHLISR